MNENKKVTKITEESGEIKIESKRVSQEQLQREYDYIRASKMLMMMLEKDLITETEFDKLTVLNRQTFSPVLAGIMA